MPTLLRACYWGPTIPSDTMEFCASRIPLPSCGTSTSTSGEEIPSYFHLAAILKMQSERVGGSSSVMAGDVRSFTRLGSNSSSGRVADPVQFSGTMRSSHLDTSPNGRIRLRSTNPRFDNPIVILRQAIRLPISVCTDEDAALIASYIKFIFPNGDVKLITTATARDFAERLSTLRRLAGLLESTDPELTLKILQAYQTVKTICGLTNAIYTMPHDELRKTVRKYSGLFHPESNGPQAAPNPEKFNSLRQAWAVIESSR